MLDQASERLLRVGGELTTAGAARRLGVARILALAICLGLGIALVLANVFSWQLEDSVAYWRAALRLREGLDLYVAVPVGADETLAYRYAPWLAWAWVPLTYLPPIVVASIWSAILGAATAFALWPLLTRRSVASLCLLAIGGGLMIRTASTGNVHALLIGALVWGAPRRSGPFWIGLAASLKVAPILYVLVYAGRGEWRRVLVALATAIALWAPAALYDLSHYPTDPGGSFSLLSSVGPVAWILVAGGASCAAYLGARTKYNWIASSMAVLAAIPRLALYDLTYLLVGISSGVPDERPLRPHEPG